MSDITSKTKAYLISIRQTARTARIRAMARRAKARNIPTEFAHYPDARATGSYEVGQSLEHGEFLFAGQQISSPNQSIWALNPPTSVFLEHMHGFYWLDDLAAVGDPASRKLAQAWAMDWVMKYGSGKGVGWTPAITGQRIMQICSHGQFLFREMEKPHVKRMMANIARQVDFLRKSWRKEAAGLGRLQALTGLIYAGVSFSNAGKVLEQANENLGAQCGLTIDARGGIATRNPEELAAMFRILTWATRTLEDAKATPDPRLSETLEHIAPTLRGMRLGDGTLARFHGGGRGRAGEIDEVLSEARVRSKATHASGMGYERVTAGRLAIIMDVDAPPTGRYSVHGHASTLAFEMSSGRFPLLVNCGAGQKFGRKWERACRLTAAHNTLSVERASSSTIAPEGFVSGILGERLLTVPQEVTHSRTNDEKGCWLVAAHDGYAPTHGLVHQRRLFVSPNGREVRGQDNLLAQNDAHRAAFKKVTAIAPQLGVAFSVHFHLHPSVQARMTEDGDGVALRLPNHEIWLFRHEGGNLALENSVYLDQWRLEPHATKQIVVSGRAIEYAGRVTWILKRIQDGERRTD